MHITFKTEFCDGVWIAGWSGMTPAGRCVIIVTEAQTKSDLRIAVEEALLCVPGGFQPTWDIE